VIPEPWEFVLLALAAFRAWKLIGDDAILDRPRDWAVKHRPTLELFLACPYCLGAWCSLAAYAGWIAVGPGTWDPDELFMAIASLGALSGTVGLVGARAHPAD
jgi:hypothetical protein